MNSKPELFGLYGFTHGWAKILTVMSPQGTTATIATIGDGADLRLEARDGQLPRFCEMREGALKQLIDNLGIVILNKTEWDEQKALLGETIFL